MSLCHCRKKSTANLPTKTCFSGKIICMWGFIQVLWKCVQGNVAIEMIIRNWLYFILNHCFQDTYGKLEEDQRGVLGTYSCPWSSRKLLIIPWFGLWQLDLFPVLSVQCLQIQFTLLDLELRRHMASMCKAMLVFIRYYSRWFGEQGWKSMEPVG